MFCQLTWVIPAIDAVGDLNSCRRQGQSSLGDVLGAVRPPQPGHTGHLTLRVPGTCRAVGTDRVSRT